MDGINNALMNIFNLAMSFYLPSLSCDVSYRIICYYKIY